MLRGLRECVFLGKVKTALQNHENHKDLLKDPVRPNEEPWLVMDLVGGSSCVPRVPRFLMFRMPKYGQYSHLAPPLIKDYETPAWLGLRSI